jgi:hypothetical protein
MHLSDAFLSSLFFLLSLRTRGSSVPWVCYGLDDKGFEFRQEQEVFIFLKLGEWLWGSHGETSLKGVKQPECDVDRSPSCGAEG